ncbi:MAG: undecaprenyl-diphosphate phosphatase [Kiritimatiellales bacterium]
MSVITFLKAVLLGFVEGITEFLPISSTGHMILVDAFLQLSENKQFSDAFTIFIQTGATLAVIVLFRRELWPFAGTAEERKNKWLLWMKVAVAFFPAVILGLLCADTIEHYLFTPQTVACALIFYGVALVIFEKTRGMKTGAIQDITGITFKTALFIGCFQCLALVPGTSRSAATILGGMLLRLDRRIAAEFSFFLAVPTLTGAGAYKLMESGAAFSGAEYLILATGFMVAFIVAACVIQWLMNYLRKHSFTPFGWYRIVLGVIVLLWWFR